MTRTAEQRRHSRRYRFLACAVLIALTVPRLTQQGMFGDGMLYAAIARNMSIGEGSLWAPSFSATAYREFFEHPPPGFWLEALAFAVGGDHPAVERVYSLTLFALQAWLITALWRRFLPASHDWLPLMFWVMPSIVTWAAVNNMLENTQTLFTTLAVYLFLRTSAERSATAVVLWSIGAGASVVAGVLTKGPVALFPLAVPVLSMMLPPGVRPARPFLSMAIMTGVMAAAATAASAYGPSSRALSEYLRTQLVPSLQGKREVNSDPLAAIRHLGLGVVARMALVVGALWLRVRRKPANQTWTIAAFFLAIGLCASVPIAVSPKMMGQYFLPSVPFFALGMAALAAPLLRSWSGPVNTSTWARRAPVALASILLVASVLVPMLHGSIEPRDVTLVRALNSLADTMPRGITVGTCEASAEDWRIMTYLQRFFRVSLDADGTAGNGWFLQSEASCRAPAECSFVDGSGTLALFKCSAGVGR